MSKKYTERNKSVIELYKIKKNMAEVARQFGISRERVRQLLSSNNIKVDKKGKQGEKGYTHNSNK